MSSSRSAPTSAASGKSVETIVENRNLRQSVDAAFLVDGRSVAATAGSTQTVSATLAHLDGVGGYLFPGGATVNVKREDRTGTCREVSTANPSASPVEILQNTNVVHAVRRTDGSIVAANFWQAGSVDFRLVDGKPVRITADHACALVLRWSKNGLEVAASDPTQKAESIRVVVEQAGWHLAARDATVRVDGNRKNELVLTVDTASAAGASHRAAFVTG